MRAPRLRLLVSLGAACVFAFGCASGRQCEFNSQCGERSYCMGNRCRQDCRLDLDCAAGMRCNDIGQCAQGVDAGPTPDAGRSDAGRSDAGRSDAGPTDAGRSDAGRTDAGRSDAGRTDAGRDGGPTPSDAGGDAGPTATGAYLDRCAGIADCASSLCLADVDGVSRFCSRSCGAHSDCADEHICVGSVCIPDDTGTPCMTASHSCHLFCFGNETAAHCTRECDSARDCPAGYACVDGGSTRICADIERPGGTCVTTMFFAVEGCTGDCRTADDCPSRYTSLGLMPYTCAVPSGGTTPQCLPPPGETGGSDPIGTSCPPAGGNTCRSSACNPDSLPQPHTCTQTCGAEGGCGPGFGCFAEQQDDGSYLPVCEVSGSGVLGAPCTTRNDCDSAICVLDRCTRYCADGLCPTGWTCAPSGAPNIPSVCLPP